MLTRSPLAFSMITSSNEQGTAPEVLLFVTCPCSVGSVVLHRSTSICTTPSCQLGILSNNFSSQLMPRWCFPDSNSCISAPSTPVPETYDISMPNFQQLAPPPFDHCNGDLSSLESTERVLKTCGFYYGSLSWQKAAEMLQQTSVGTFLVRDSADPHHLYSLSVQTDRGPTSVRINYSEGRFRLDCEDRLTNAMPTFHCVLRLIEHYAELSRTAQGDCCVWLDGTGKRDLRVRLYRPLYSQVPSLKHACRIAVNSSLCRGMETKQRNKFLADLNLPASVKGYLMDYQFGL